MSFYDESIDLMELFKAAEAGDVSAMIQFVSYVSTMTTENDILQGLKNKYIDNLVKEQNAVGLIWKAEELLKGELNEEVMQAVLAAFSLAAIKGQLFAIEEIGDLYFEGKGVEQDWDIAHHIFMTAINTQEGDTSSLAFYKEGVIQEYSENYENAMKLYYLAFDVAGEWADMDDNAILAKTAYQRLKAWGYEI